jgi:hypothetical protein
MTGVEDKTSFGGNKPLLDFTVKGLWNCPPMPTKAARLSERIPPWKL